jgi:hypothetical protein
LSPRKRVEREEIGEFNGIARANGSYSSRKYSPSISQAAPTRKIP